MIEVRELTKTFGPHKAVDGLSFSAPPGSVTAFLGPNGAGKSTTLRCLLGLMAPTAGTTTIDGRPYRALRAPRERVGALVETSGFHPARSARNHLRVIARAATIPGGRVEPVLELVGLSDAADRRVGGFSLGMRQRLGLATLLLGDPGVIVLDEPTNGLDPEGVAWIRQLMRCWAAQGRAVLVSSHLLGEIAQTADRIVIINRGRLIAEGDIDTLTSQRVQLRVDDPVAMRAALDTAGLRSDELADGALVVTGATPAMVAAVGQRAGVTVTELTSQTAGEALEALFLATTGNRA
jgi:ABC-2 type transport system ATP-binding protein